jgi:heme/copper-type cytochrome/quinol oxidase subunit 2
MWDPKQYERFRAERSRPVFDLIARIPDKAYKSISDLGCGTGDLTAALSDHWPEARVLGVDNSIVVPVNKVVEVETTGADVIHSWALPEMGVKMDAVPGRINHTWFKATRTGTFYGECSELCGAKHAFMPIEVKVVTDAQYAAWLTTAKKKFAAIEDGNNTRLAAQQ